MGAEADKTVVIMPTYNGEKYLDEQISSILGQTYRSFVLHVFDDNSSDQTGSILAKHARQDNRIKVYRNPERKGVIKNINDALMTVTADIYFLADQDDIWLPDKMAKQMAVLNVKDAVMTFTDLSLINEKGEHLNIDYWSSQGIDPSHADRPEYLSIKSMITGCTMAFKKEVLEYALPIPEKAMMHDHWLSLFGAKAGRVVAVPECLVLYRQHAQNVIGALDTPEMQRKNRYDGCLTYREYKVRKIASFRQLHDQLLLIHNRFQETGEISQPIKEYIAFYEYLVEKRWNKAIMLAFRIKKVPNANSFIRTALVAMFFPIFIPLLKTFAR